MMANNNSTNEYIHIDDTVFNHLKTQCLYYTDMIENWKALESGGDLLYNNTVILWQSLSYFEPFERLAIESAALCGTDIRQFINKTPYKLCWISLKILNVERQLLRNLALMGFFEPPTNTHSTAELPSIPDWMRRAITSAADNKSIADRIEAMKRIYPVNDTLPGYLQERCPVCSMLRL